MIGRAEIEGSKSHVAMNAWRLQASYPRTRGVGVATAMAYSRTCTTWNPREIGRIVSVHQVYRVHLLCAHVKLYKAQQIQTECLSVYGALRRIIVNDQIREMMETVGQLPSAMMAVMDAIGRIEVDERVYHMGYAEIPAIKKSQLSQEIFVSE